MDIIISLRVIESPFVQLSSIPAPHFMYFMIVEIVSFSFDWDVTLAAHTVEYF